MDLFPSDDHINKPKKSIEKQNKRFYTRLKETDFTILNEHYNSVICLLIIF